MKACVTILSFCAFLFSVLVLGDLIAFAGQEKPAKEGSAAAPKESKSSGNPTPFIFKWSAPAKGSTYVFTYDGEDISYEPAKPGTEKKKTIEKYSYAGEGVLAVSEGGKQTLRIDFKPRSLSIDGIDQGKKLKNFSSGLLLYFITPEGKLHLEPTVSYEAIQQALKLLTFLPDGEMKPGEEKKIPFELPQTAKMPALSGMLSLTFKGIENPNTPCARMTGTFELASPSSPKPEQTVKAKWTGAVSSCFRVSDGTLLENSLRCTIDLDKPFRYYGQGFRVRAKQEIKTGLRLR